MPDSPDTILLIGSGAREHAVFRALGRAPSAPRVAVYGSARNPGLATTAAAYTVGDLTDPAAVVAFARECGATLAFPGPEAPLAAGVVDALEEAGIPTAGPRQALARIETSKGYARDFLERQGLSAVQPRFRRFSSLEGMAAFFDELEGRYVVKADGLMGGKGVRVAGEDLENPEDGLAWAGKILETHDSVVVEELCEGPEFSLFTFTDGASVVHSPLVLDHKRVHEGDEGPNTGGMGSLSLRDHGLPFVSPSLLKAARLVNESVLECLAEENGHPYRGVLYGGFMVTAGGLRVIEYNARLGDPEALNLMTLLDGDMGAALRGMATGGLQGDDLRFREECSVCKYVVPAGYPTHPRKGDPVDLSAVPPGEVAYLASVDEREGRLIATGSRTLAFVGCGATLAEAEAQAEQAAQSIPGPFFHRSDIGTDDLLARRVALLAQRIRGEE
jgi:phosphoribosylamine--glycine ligase